MKKIDLKAEERKEIGKKVKHLRLKGKIPAVIYSHDFKSMALSVDYKSYIKAISGEAGSNVIISLSITDKKGEPLPAITHDIQRDPLTDKIIHVDFHKINMKEKIHTKIPVELTGEPVGVKEEAGILVHSLTELEVECLPMDIPDKVEIDVSMLKIGDSLHVADLRSKLGSEVAILTEDTVAIAQVVPPAKEEIAPAPVEGAVPVEGEVPAEGVPPAEGDAAKTAKPAAQEKAAK